jgi:hypothetical protein
MQYKTIILELIEARPQLHERLKTSRTLLSTVDRFAHLLKESHLGWIEQLQRARPGVEPPQLASEALELALNQIGMVFATNSESDETDPLTLDEAIQFVRQHKPQD